MTPEHEHNYVFKGTYYELSRHPMPGTGAQARYMVDVFFCSRCLDEVVKNERNFGNSYQPTEGILPR